MQPHPDAQGCAIRPGVLSESPLRRNRRPHCILRPGEHHQEGISLGVDHLAMSFIERHPEQMAVFLQDLRVPAIAEALEQLG
jgi:hypothetical protein